MEPVKTLADKSGLVISITAYAYQRMRYLVQNVDAEVAWFGTVTRENNTFTIDEIYLPNQEVTASSVNAGAEEMSGLLPEIIEKYGEEKALQDIIPNMRAFCHSHHKMDTFWSATDENGINGLANSQFLVSLVLNRAGNILGRVDLFTPVRVTLDKVPVLIDFDSTCDELDAEIEAKVTEKKYMAAAITPVHGKPWKPGIVPTYGAYGAYGSAYDENGAFSGYGGSDAGYNAYGQLQLGEEIDIVEKDKTKKNKKNKSIDLVSCYSLPYLASKVTPELKPLEAMIRRSTSREGCVRDIITLLYASNYMSHSILERKDELAEMFNDILNSAITTVLSPAIQFEIASMIEMFADEELLKTKDPNMAVKGCTIAAAHKLCDFIFSIKASNTHCPKP